jgi:hypothetical protein
MFTLGINPILYPLLVSLVLIDRPETARVSLTAPPFLPPAELSPFAHVICISHFFLVLAFRVLS